MRRAHLLTPLLVLPLLASCSGAANNSSGSTAMKGSAQGTVPAPSRAQPVSDPALPRAVIRTARIAVSVTDTDAAADKAVAIATSQHGRVDSDTRSQDGRGTATLVLRVPPASVERTLAAVARLGKESNRAVSDQDVTSQTIDVASRVATQRASVARVRALLARAQSLTDITRIEGELTNREASLESLQNRQQALAAQVDLAAVTVSLSGTQPQTGPVQHAGFVDGISGGWKALTGTARVLAVIAGALLPWSWIVVLVLLARVAWRRWRPADL